MRTLFFAVTVVLSTLTVGLFFCCSDDDSTSDGSPSEDDDETGDDDSADDDSGSDVDDDDAEVDYGGVWCAALWGCFPAEVEIVLDGKDAAFTLHDGSGGGTGQLEGNTLAINGNVDLWGDFTLSLEFSTDGKTFSGEYGITGDETFAGRATGKKQICSPLDPDEEGVPQIVEADYIDLEKIQRISRFRSGIGHDYSDSEETCRSMKHYFVPKTGEDWQSVEIFSPIDGDVCDIDEESAGVQVKIRSLAYPEALVVLFHVNVPGLALGDTVTAGQPIGVHAGVTTWSDVAVSFQPASGRRLVSYFDAMTDELFARYQARGMAARAEAIITREKRDQDPLSCDGETFADEGNLENWVDLD